MSYLSVTQSWRKIKLGSIIELKYGKSLPAKTRDGGKFPVYGSNGVVGSHSAPLVNCPGIIVGRKGSFGEVRISNEPFFPIDTTYYVDELHGQPTKYWYYQLKFLPLNQLNRATAIPGLNRDDAYNQDIALPSLAEQKTIADKLDTLLAQVEATKARLERIPKILKRFRQSVLAAAVSGRMTEGRGFESSEKWEYPKIQDVGKIQLGRQRSPKFHSGENMKPYLRVQNVFEDHIDTSDVMSMEFSEDDFKRYKLVEGDILLNEGQSPKFLGRPAVYRGELADACFTNTLIRFRAGERTFPEYALIVFRNHMHSGRYIKEGTITTNIAHLGLGRFGNVEFPLPSLEEQREVVKRVDRLFSCADRIERQSNNALISINNLTQSILAKAFRGELTEQWRKDNPDLISGENSAEALFQRIKAEREKLSAQKPKRQKRSKQ